MSFARWKQRMMERLKRVPVSEYSPEFQAGLRMVDNTEVGSQRLVEGVLGLGTRYWNVTSGGAGGGKKVRTGLSGAGREFPSERLATIAEELAGAASAHTHYAAHMLKLSRTQRAETVEQQSLATELDRDIVTPWRDWLKTEAPDFRRSKDRLYGRRLDMDCAIRVGQKAKEAHDPKRISAEAKTRLHQEAMEESQCFVDRLPSAHAKQQRALASLALSLRSFHSKNVNLLTTSLFELGIDLPFPPAPPYTELPPPS